MDFKQFPHVHGRWTWTALTSIVGKNDSAEILTTAIYFPEFSLLKFYHDYIINEIQLLAKNSQIQSVLNRDPHSLCMISDKHAVEQI